MTTFSRRLSILLLLLGVGEGGAQPKGPQPWWPTQPTPLPFVHPLFSDDMVLQRDIAAPVWGWSEPGDTVTVSVDDKPAGLPAVAGKDGKWITRVGPFTAGGPHTVAIAGQARKAAFKNVLFGDVWLCSGQSNMNWPVRLAANGDEEVKNANHPEIRSFTVSYYPSLVPTKLPPPAKWEACTPELVRNFTAVGYFYAREINQTQKVPIGIIHSSVGATTAESWVSSDALRKRMPYDFTDRLKELDDLVAVGGQDYDYFQAIEKWLAKVDPASAKLGYATDPDLKTGDWFDIAVPKPWEETGIEQLKDFDGLVWFRHTLNIPETWKGKDLQLTLSIIKDVDVVWFNGTLIGAKQVGGIRTYTVDARLVKPGKNLLATAVLNEKGPGGFCSDANNMLIKPMGGTGTDSIRPAGTWKAKIGAKLADIAMPFPGPQVGHYKTIAAHFNGMIAPLVPFAIKGVLWYQGEANGPFWLQYRRLLPTLIADWRERFGVGDFPFLIVSLAGYNPVQTKPVEPGWAEIRESQWRTARKIPNCGLAVTIDIGDARDIHPRNKQEAGHRLALVARNLVYGEKDLVYSGPEFNEMQIELPKGDRIRLYFKHVHGGLTISKGDEKLLGFTVAGPDKNFVWADAVIDGDTIVVSSPDVPDPKYVRYGWAWNPIGNLYNKHGLPAITFRTDE